MEFGMHVLIADDSASIRRNLGKLLRPVDGITRISEAGDVTHTLQQLETDTPDVLILDLQMPDGSGLEVLAVVREKRLEVKIIVLTTFATEHNRKRCGDLGADFFFDKTREYERVVEEIGRLAST
jgi:DNA-binding NarL/FixJ family response regulator